MKCDCCGRKKRLFESFDVVNKADSPMYVCAECAALVYAVRGAIQESASEPEADLLNDLKKRQRKGKGNPSFMTWFNSRCDAWRRGER